MKRNISANLTALIVWLLPVAYLLWSLPSLPQSVPMHFGMDGKPDRYGSHDEFFLVQLLMSGIAAGVYLLLQNLQSIDPKRNSKYSKDTFQKIAFAVVVFVSAINIVIIYAVTHNGFRIDKLLFPIIGLFFIYLGNLMHSIKPNYFAGIRTPWALEDEGNWRSTHRLAGKLMVAGGFAITLSGLLLSGKLAFTAIMIVAFTIVVIPFIHSFLYYKKHISSK
jgi:uncharacterized membrane protein